MSTLVYLTSAWLDTKLGPLPFRTLVTHPPTLKVFFGEPSFTVPDLWSYLTLCRSQLNSPLIPSDGIKDLSRSPHLAVVLTLKGVVEGVETYRSYDTYGVRQAGPEAGSMSDSSQQYGQCLSVGNWDRRRTFVLFVSGCPGIRFERRRHFLEFWPRKVTGILV